MFACSLKPHSSTIDSLLQKLECHPLLSVDKTQTLLSSEVLHDQLVLSLTFRKKTASALVPLGGLLLLGNTRLTGSLP